MRILLALLLLFTGMGTATAQAQAIEPRYVIGFWAPNDAPTEMVFTGAPLPEQFTLHAVHQIAPGLVVYPEAGLLHLTDDLAGALLARPGEPLLIAVHEVAAETADAEQEQISQAAAAAFERQMRIADLLGEIRALSRGANLQTAVRGE
ncbi:MAG: hypothetical protein AAFU34_17450 [Pseudomonadota bacterium]